MPKILNDDISSYLLNVGRHNPEKRRLLAPWIPKIRMFPVEITHVDQISMFPTYVQEEVENALDAHVIPVAPAPTPHVPVPHQTELARLARELPVELRLRIFGNAMECATCKRRMYDFDQENISNKRWLLIGDDTRFCGWGCRMTHILKQNRGYDASNDFLIDSLRRHTIPSQSYICSGRCGSYSGCPSCNGTRY